MGPFARIKGILPWWAKIAAKVALARLPLGGRAWQGLGLFSPGEMDDPDYARTIFDAHYHAAGSPAPGFSFLELGPGDSLAAAIIGYAHGAKSSWLVDSGAYATGNMDFYRRLIDMVADVRPDSDLVALRAGADVPALLSAAGSRYLENGLGGLQAVPSESCDYVFSQAVLEHVPRSEFAATMSEIHRILKPGGVSTHQVDFRDHLGGGLNNLRFSDKLWEAPWFARRSGFYTNRLRLSEMTALMTRAGFAVDIARAARWQAPPLARARLAPGFATLAEDDLLVREAFIVLSKKRRGRKGGTRQAVFLDRDGTINWNEVRDGKPYAPTRLEDFRYLPGAPGAIARFREAGYLVIVVTNQPDLTTGKNSIEVIEAMHARLRDELGIDGIVVCPHTAEAGCECRKPKPGLLYQAAETWGIDLSRSVMVGDRWRDIDAGRAAGCHTVHVDHGYEGEPAAKAPDLTVGSLAEAAESICAWLEKVKT